MLDSIAGSVYSPGPSPTFNSPLSSGLSACSPGLTSGFGSAAASGIPTQGQTIETHKKALPSHNFVLQAISPSKTPSWRKEPSTTPKMSLEKPREFLGDDQPTPKPKASSILQSTGPMTEKLNPIATNPVQKSTSNKSTGGILLIAQSLRELATAAALARMAYVEPQAPQALPIFQAEQYSGVRNEIERVAVTEVNSNVVASGTGPLMLTKDQAEWCEQRAKVSRLIVCRELDERRNCVQYTQHLRRFVDRCWDPEMELGNVFRRLNLWVSMLLRW